MAANDWPRGDPIKIELERDYYNSWSIRYGHLSESCLCLDEALGCVASIMFTGRAPYLKNPIQHAIWNSRYTVTQDPSGRFLLPETASKMTIVEMIPVSKEIRGSSDDFPF